MDITNKQQGPGNDFFIWIDEEIYELPVYKQHVHNFCQTVSVSRKEVRYVIKGKTLVLKGGDFLVIPPDIPHCPDGGQYENDVKSIEMKFFITRDLSRVFPFAAEPVIIRIHHDRINYVRDLQMRIIDEWRRREETVQEAVGYQLQYLFLLLKRELSAPAAPTVRRPSDPVSLAVPRKRRITYKVKSFIDGHYREQIQFGTLARQHAISISYLSEIFKQETGHSLSGYLNRTRIERARVLMKTSEMNFTQIAEAVGYRNVYYFSKVFKDTTGITPSRYRHMLNDTVQSRGYLATDTGGRQ